MIELNKQNIAIMVFSLLFISAIVFRGGQYIIDKKTREYRDEILVNEVELFELKNKNNDLQKADKVYRDSLRTAREEIIRLEEEVRKSLEELEEEPSEVADKLDVSEQQEYFDKRYPYNEAHVVALDSLQGRDIVEHLEQRDLALVSLRELNKLHLTYKEYALKAGQIISNQEEIIANLDSQLAQQKEIMESQAKENKKLQRLYKRQRFRTKLVTSGGVLLVAAAAILI